MKFFVSALFSLVVFFAGQAHADDCSLQRVVDMPITYDDHGAPTVMVTIAGTQHRFILELGFSISALTAALADSLNMHRTTSANVGAWVFEMPTDKIASVSGLQFGNVVIKTAHFFEVPKLPDGDEGVLGLDVLETFDFELDLGHNRAALYLPNSCPGAGVYWANSSAAIPIKMQKLGNILIPMMLDGKAIDVGLSSEGGPDLMPTPVTKALFGIDESSPDIKPAEENNDLNKFASLMALRPGAEKMRFFRYPFKMLSAGGLAIENPNIVLFTDKPPSQCIDKARPNRSDWDDPGATITCYGGALLRLQLQQLKQLRMYFAFRQKMLYLTGASATLPAPTAIAK
ncbi:MAG TPA: hypothetical protein VGG10_15490 [Rhizomicrobium sp.]|jgi:hypothetical protein